MQGPEIKVGTCFFALFVVASPCVSRSRRGKARLTPPCVYLLATRVFFCTCSRSRGVMRERKSIIPAIFIHYLFITISFLPPENWFERDQVSRNWGKVTNYASPAKRALCVCFSCASLVCVSFYFLFIFFYPVTVPVFCHIIYFF